MYPRAVPKSWQHVSNGPLSSTEGLSSTWDSRLIQPKKTNTHHMKIKVVEEKEKKETMCEKFGRTFKASENG